MTTQQVKQAKKLIIAIEWLKAAMRRETDEAKLKRMRADLERLAAEVENAGSENASG